jgi:hypothetical protein
MFQRFYVLVPKARKFWCTLRDIVKALFVCGLDNNIGPDEYTWVIEGSYLDQYAVRQTW